LRSRFRCGKKRIKAQCKIPRNRVSSEIFCHPTEIFSETRFLRLCTWKIKRNRVSSEIFCHPTEIFSETRFLRLCNNPRYNNPRNRVSSEMLSSPTEIFSETRFLRLCTLQNLRKIPRNRVSSEIFCHQPRFSQKPGFLDFASNLKI